MGKALELIEKYARGVALYFGWFFRSPRAEAEPLNLATDARLLICAVLTLIGGLLLYYKLFDHPPEQLLGLAARKDFNADFGKIVVHRAVVRLTLWAVVAALAHLLCSIRSARIDLLDTVSAVLRVAPVASFLATAIGALILHVHYALRPDWSLSQMLGRVMIPVIGAALLGWALPRSLRVESPIGPRRALAVSIVCALLVFVVGLYSTFAESSL